jgi:hypothetical protein
MGPYIDKPGAACCELDKNRQDVAFEYSSGSPKKSRAEIVTWCKIIAHLERACPNLKSGFNGTTNQDFRRNQSPTRKETRDITKWGARKLVPSQASFVQQLEWESERQARKYFRFLLRIHKTSE